MTYHAAAALSGDQLGFGDICEADFLHDIHVRKDARVMGTQEMGGAFAKKQFNVDYPVRYYLPEQAQKPGENFVLAHGGPGNAIVLSDNCAIETNLGRPGASPKHRLLFAPVADATADEVADLEAGGFGRFPLPADARVAQHRVVDLRRCFMVDARDVREALTAGGFRQRSLDEEALSGLAIRWSAFAIRRGPFVSANSLEKFAQHLVATGAAPTDLAGALVSALLEVVQAAWIYEGEAVEGAGVAADEELAPDAVLAKLDDTLSVLGDSVSDALQALHALQG